MIACIIAYLLLGIKGFTTTWRTYDEDLLLGKAFDAVELLSEVLNRFLKALFRSPSEFETNRLSSLFCLNCSFFLFDLSKYHRRSNP
jgi:hypothetical protein